MRRPIAAVAVVFLATVSSGWAASYDPAADFEQGWAANSNPNGVWSYGYSSGFTAPVTLFDSAVQNGVNGPQAQYWLSSTVDIGTTPAVEFNDGAAYDDTNIDFLANELVLVAGIGGQYADLVFTAPAYGSYSVAGDFRGDQYRIGTAAAVTGSGAVLFQSTVTAEGQTVPFSTEIVLHAGSTVVFSVGPDGGLQNTGLDATITLAIPGDANLDGRVDINDLTVVLTNFGQTGATWSQGEFTGSGTVDVNDLTIVLANFGTSSGAGIRAVPEPTGISLLAAALAGLAVYGWRKPP